MADCAVAPDGLCLRIAPPESLDVTKLAHAFVTLARPRRGCRSRAAWLCAVLGPRRRPAGQDPIRASTRGQGPWPPWACWPGLCQRTTRSTPGKLIIVVTVNVRRRGRLRADAWPRSAPPVRRLLQRHRPEVVASRSRNGTPQARTCSSTSTTTATPTRCATRGPLACSSLPCSLRLCRDDDRAQAAWSVSVRALRGCQPSH